MPHSIDSVDVLEEFRLRRWARENYCFAEARQASWHPIVHEEMRRRDAEGLGSEEVTMLPEFDEPHDSADSTMTADPVAADDRAAVTPAPSEEEVLPAGRLVPLAPDISGLHGPHEISPPHAKATVRSV